MAVFMTNLVRGTWAFQTVGELGLFGAVPASRAGSAASCSSCPGRGSSREPAPILRGPTS
jgi:hypothetical protein